MTISMKRSVQYFSVLGPIALLMSMNAHAHEYILLVGNICLEYTKDFKLLGRVDIAKCQHHNRPLLDELHEIIEANETNLKDLDNYLEQCRREYDFIEKFISLRDTPPDELRVSAQPELALRDSIDNYDKETPLYQFRLEHKRIKEESLSSPSSANEVHMAVTDIDEQYLIKLEDEIEEKEDSLAQLQENNAALKQKRDDLTQGYVYNTFVNHHFKTVAANAALDDAELIFMGYATMEKDKPALIQEIIRKFSSAGDLVLVHTVDLGAMVDWSKRQNIDPLKEGFHKFFTEEMKDKLSVKGWDHKSIIQTQRASDLWSTMQMAPGPLSSSQIQSEHNALGKISESAFKGLMGHDERLQNLIKSIPYFKDPDSEFNKRYPKSNYLKARVFYISTENPITNHYFIQVLRGSNKKFVVMTLPHASMNLETFNKAINFYGKPGLL